MKRTVLYGAFLVGSLSLAACQQHNETNVSEPDLTGKEVETSQITDCKIKVGDVTFTKSINGADTCVTILTDGGLKFSCPEGLDFFCDPNEGKQYTARIADSNGQYQTVHVDSQSNS